MRALRVPSRRLLPGPRKTAVLLALSLLALPAQSALADVKDFPRGYEAYHTYAEVVAVMDATVAAYPQIARKFSVGKSHEGRTIWALKISDNVARDEPEPEVLSVSLLHAREHITTEMNLYLIRLLTQNYGSNERITKIVNTREIFVIPSANPDGAEWDIASGAFRQWRKNRQPIPGSTDMGIDLNRNFGFKWGCCGGSSTNPGSLTYRGPKAWHAPETRVLRDFVGSRVVDGRQQIKAIFDWHSYGEQILWPYGYTMSDVPRTMSADDHAALVAMGKEMASLNGYRPMQASDLYVYDGDLMAWAYGVHRIIGFTFEMFPATAKAGGFYPDPAVLVRETTRNRRAVLYMLEQADCPHRAGGLGATHCGPLSDDFETARGWSVNPAGTDTAVAGAWQRAQPRKTATAAGVKQLATTPSGQRALVTGAAAGANANANDVDGGVTTMRSAAFKLDGGDGWRLRFRYSFAHDKRASTADFFRVSAEVSGSRTTLFEVRGAAAERHAKWGTVTVSLDGHAGQTVRLVVEAADAGPDSLIESAVDDVRVYQVAAGAAQQVRAQYFN